MVGVWGGGVLLFFFLFGVVFFFFFFFFAIFRTVYSCELFVARERSRQKLLPIYTKKVKKNFEPLCSVSGSAKASCSR